MKPSKSMKQWLKKHPCQDGFPPRLTVMYRLSGNIYKIDCETCTRTTSYWRKLQPCKDAWVAINK